MNHFPCKACAVVCRTKQKLANHVRYEHRNKKAKVPAKPKDPVMQDRGMMGYMKHLGYDIEGVPVPPGFYVWTQEERIRFLDMYNSPY
jgi:ABC-type enterochelin transport system substrate-binding protein